MSLKDDQLTSSFPNGIDGFLVDDEAVLKSAAYTVVKDTDSGKTFYITSSQTFTLPSIAAGSLGQVYKFVNLADDGKAQLTISPNALDGIAYKSDATANKDLINTLATAKKGDMVVISNNLASADYWQVNDIRGVWAKES